MTHVAEDTFYKGQSIYVYFEERFSETKTEPNLIECIVSRVTDTCIEVKSKDSRLTVPLDRKTLSRQDSGVSFTGYRTAEEYWDRIHNEKERENLLHAVKKSLHFLDTNTLKEVQSFIYEKRKTKQK